MGIKNYLIEGVSGTGKSSVCDALQYRGYHAIHGDIALAYQGDPKTGEPLDGFCHAHHIWDVKKVKDLVGDHSRPVSFFCGGSRNFHHFIDLFDEVFVLELDWNTLNSRLARRPDSEWGGGLRERMLIARLHETKEDLPKQATIIDATAPLSSVVDAILRAIAL